jgi:uncharacterized NAD-dependent epimerase/dehydratase family protein
MSFAIYYPSIQNMNVQNTRFGKLYSTTAPTIGVFGTSSKQGKWTTQLTIRRELSRLGYNVAQLGTEPTAPLFGNPYAYPMGYNGDIGVSGREAVATANYLLECVDRAQPDIIIIGGQSHSIMPSFGGLDTMPVMQHEFIMACMPQAVVLCVNKWDSKEFVQRTIGYFEGMFDAKVIAIVLSPHKNRNEWSNFGYEEIPADASRDYSGSTLFGRPLLKLASDRSMKRISQIIVDFFSSED